MESDGSKKSVTGARDKFLHKDRQPTRKRKSFGFASKSTKPKRKTTVQENGTVSQSGKCGTPKQRQSMKRPKVKWTVPNEHGSDFSTVIKNYDQLTPAARLKAKTKYDLCVTLICHRGFL